MVPLRYRLVAEIDWHEGESVNISGSGVLFRAEQSLALLTPVEVSLTLPFPVAGGQVRFDLRGQVVRALAPLSEQGRAIVAATIAAYRFVREGEPEDDEVFSG